MPELASLAFLRSQRDCFTNPLLDAAFVRCLEASWVLLRKDQELLVVDLATGAADFFEEQALRMATMPYNIFKFVDPVCVQAATGDKNLTEFLCRRGEMLREYFGIEITPKGELLALPQLLAGIKPPAHAIPQFLCALGRHVDWTDEQECFAGICSTLGKFYGSVEWDHQIICILHPAMARCKNLALSPLCTISADDFLIEPI